MGDSTAVANSPLVTVLMPVLNPHPVYFPQAVESVLQQSFQDWELLIVEDPSARPASDFLTAFRDPRIRHIQNRVRSSLADQLNQGLQEARGELVARFDGDDVCLPDRLQKQVDFLQAHADVGVLGGQLAIIDDHGNARGFRAYPRDHDAICDAIARFNPIAHPTVMYRKDLVMQAGGYQYRKYPANEDYELWSRLTVRGIRFANLPDVLIRYRIHPEGMKTAKLRGIMRGTLEVKNLYWRQRMNLRSKARMWGEKLLLYLPSPWVLKVFMALQYTETLPKEKS